MRRTTRRPRNPNVSLVLPKERANRDARNELSIRISSSDDDEELRPVRERRHNGEPLAVDKMFK